MANKTRTQSPIADTNRNGTLDSAELLSKMNAEDIAAKRQLPIHGMMMLVGVPKLIDAWNTAIQIKAMQDSDVSPQFMEKLKASAAKQLNIQITDAVDDYLIATKENPNIISETIAKIKTMPNTDEEKSQVISGIQTLAQFASHFHQDFPNGVNITPNDVLPLLAHTGKVIVGVQKDATPAAGIIS